MIQHTGAIVYLSEYRAAVKGDLYRIGEALVLDLSATGCDMLYDVERDACDYSAERIEDKRPTFMTFADRFIKPISEHAETLTHNGKIYAIVKH